MRFVGADTLVHAGQAGAGAAQVVHPEGLRRWRAILGDARYGRAPIVCIGDSITFGQGGDNTNTTTLDATLAPLSWPGQMRALFAQDYGDPGEGFLFLNDGRVTMASSPTAYNYLGPLRYGYRLLGGSAQTVTVPVPAGTTSVGVIQPHRSGDATVKASIDGAGATDVATIAGDGVYRETGIAVSAGSSHTLVLSAGASSGYLSGVVLRTKTTGVPVHRIGKTGNACGAMLGGATTGVLDQSAPNQDLAIRALCQWETPGLAIIGFGVNDQALQASTGQHAAVTTTLFDTWIRQVCTTITGLGWAVLLLGEHRNPNAYGSGSSEDAYHAVLRSIALSMDHVALLDMTDVWGRTSWSDTTMGLHVLTTSVHPSRRGHGDIARTVYQALTTTRAYAP